MSQIIHDAKVLSTEVKKVFGDLEARGFQFSMASVKHTDAIGDYVELLVLNRATGKGLLFMYAAANEIRPENISIFLQNGSGDTFSIDDFLAHKKINSQSDNSIKITNYDGSLEKKLGSLLNASKEIIFQHLYAYLFGNEWESIPIQWGDLK